MNILLTGANGFIGQHLYQQLIEAGHDVTATMRDPQNFIDRYPAGKAVAINYTQALQASDWLPLLSEIDIVINAVGIIKESREQTFEAIHHRAPVALFDACQQASIRKVVQISALGAEESAISQYHLSKRQADIFLKQSGLNYTIFKPSIVYGPGAVSTELFRSLAALPLTPVIESGSQLIQPIYIGDLSRAILISIENSSLNQMEINAVGPSSMTFKEYLQYQRSWLGLGKINTASLSLGMTNRLLKFADKLDLGPINKETVAMLMQGNSASVTPFKDLLGFTPGTVSSHLNAQPSQKSDRWYAGLFFFPWILRYSIAFVWIVTGLCSLGLYPLHLSFAILHEAGIYGPVASLSLFGGGVLDLCLGIAMLSERYLRATLMCQLLVTLTYTLIISALLPELWLHPFGPVTKNIPLFTATITLLIMIRRR